MDSGNLFILMAPVHVGGTWVRLFTEWDIWDIEVRMLTHLTDASPTLVAQAWTWVLGQADRESGWAVRNADQGGQGGLIDRPWLFASRRTTTGSCIHSAQSYSVGPGFGGKGKGERWQTVTKGQVLRQPFKAFHFHEKDELQGSFFLLLPSSTAPSKLKGIWARVQGGEWWGETLITSEDRMILSISMELWFYFLIEILFLKRKNTHMDKWAEIQWKQMVLMSFISSKTFSVIPKACKIVLESLDRHPWFDEFN